MSVGQLDLEACEEIVFLLQTRWESLADVYKGTVSLENAL